MRAGLGVGGALAVTAAAAGVVGAAVGLGAAIGIPRWAQIGVAAAAVLVASLILGLTLAQHTAEPRARSRRRRGWTEDHFGPRARGVARRTESGQDFTGRTAALEQIAAWLRGEPGGLCVVTGNPGSGKSAVLGRVVSVASVDVAVWAKGLREEQVVEEIARALRVRASDADDLVGAVAARGRPAVIVLDALDEAPAGNGGARHIAQHVIKPLAATGRDCGVKLLVGTRRGHHGELLQDLGATPADVIDLDAPAYLERHDLVEYVRRRLVRESEPEAHTPYRGLPEAAALVASAIAARAGNSFLVAQLVSGAVRRDAAVVDTARAGWERQFAADVGPAMDDYLDRFEADADVWRARELLTALAYGEAAGLPHALWPQIAGALAGKPYGADDAHWLLRSPAGDLVIRSGGAAPHYRLFHEALAERLRDRSGDQRACQERIVGALEAAVPDHDWSAAPPYVRAHLAAHAAAGGALDRLLEDPGFLIAAEPAGLLAALPAVTSAEGAPVRRAYRQVAHLLPGRPDAERASYLVLAARRVGAPALADRIAGARSERPWTAVWARWEHAGEFFLAGRHEDDVLAMVVRVAVGDVHGRPVALTAAATGTLRTWDLDGGGPFGAGHIGRHPGARAVCLGTREGRPAAVSGGADGTLCVWDLLGGGRLGEPLTGKAEVKAVAAGEVGGRDVAVTGGADGNVHVWDLAAGGLLYGPLRGHDGAVQSVAVRAGVALTGGADGTVRTWDLRAGRPLREPVRLGGGGAWAVALGEAGGAVLAAAGGNAGAQVWNATTGEPAGPPLPDARFPLAVALGELDGRAVAVTAADEFRLCVWDVAGAKPLRVPSTGHGWAPGMVAAGVAGGRPLAVAGGGEGEVWAYDLLAAAGAEQAPGHAGGVFWLAITELDGRAAVVSAGALDPSIRVWDLADGALRGGPADAGDGLRALAVSGTLAASAAKDGRLQLWDLAAGSLVGESTSGGYGVSALHLGRRFLLARSPGLLLVWDPADLTPFGEPFGDREPAIATASALATLDGRAVLVLGHEDGRLSLWDAGTGKPLGETPTGHAGRVDAIAVAGHLAVSGGEDHTLRVWDLGARAPRGDAPVDHGDEVDAIAVAQRAGRPVIVSGRGETMCVWTLDGEPLAAVDAGSHVNCLAARGATVVAGTYAGLLGFRL